LPEPGVWVWNHARLLDPGASLAWLLNLGVGFDNHTKPKYLGSDNQARPEPCVWNHASPKCYGSEGHKIFTFGLWASCLFKTKSTVPPGGEKYACVERLLRSFFYWNNSNAKLYLDFKRNKVICRGIFIVFIWFYCKYYMGLPDPSAWV